MATIRKSSKKERFGWYIYDWAISAFSTTVITVFMGPYLTNIAFNASIDGYIYPLGIKVFVDSFFPYVISLSVACQLLILPIIGIISDNTNNKKQLLMFFTIIGSISTICLYFLDGKNYLFGGLILLISNICFGAAMVVYNSYLAIIAEVQWRDKVSSIGWGIGYLGGGLLLLINLIIYNYSDKLFIENPQNTAIRISLASAGLWWFIFSIFTFVNLKNNKYDNNHIEKNIIKRKVLLNAISGIKGKISDLKNYKNALIFLIAFMFYNDGVQATIVMAAQFAQREIGLNTDSIIVAILLVQFMAFIGAFLFNYISKPLGSKNSIILLIIIWSLSLFFAYLYLQTKQDFYILSAVIAIGMGGIQSLSRSLFSKLIPDYKQGEFFGIYELSEKGSSFLGPLAFGIAMEITHSYRIGILSLVIFFIIGLLLLTKVKYKENEIN